MRSKSDVTLAVQLEEAILGLRRFNVGEHLIKRILKALNKCSVKAPFLPLLIQRLKQGRTFEFSSVTEEQLSELQIYPPPETAPAWEITFEAGFEKLRLPAAHHATCDLVAAYYGTKCEALCRAYIDLYLLAAAHRVKVMKASSQLFPRVDLHYFRYMVKFNCS